MTDDEIIREFVVKWDRGSYPAGQRKKQLARLAEMFPYSGRAVRGTNSTKVTPPLSWTTNVPTLLQYWSHVGVPKRQIKAFEATLEEPSIDLRKVARWFLGNHPTSKDLFRAERLRDFDEVVSLYVPVMVEIGRIVEIKTGDAQFEPKSTEEATLEGPFNMERPKGFLGGPGEAVAIGPESGRPPKSGNGIARFVSRHGSYRYVAFVDGRGVSALQVMSKDGEHGRIAIVFTDAAYRREGWASKLLKRARQDFESIDHAPEIDRTQSGLLWSSAVGEEMAKRKKATEHAPSDIRTTNDPLGAKTTIPDESGPRRIGAGTYEAVVRQTLMTLGSKDPDSLVRASGDFMRNCQAAGVDGKTCAATIYGSERHRHEVARTTINEASEGAVEEWEVVVRRHGASMDRILGAAAPRKPDEVRGADVIFGEFYDDEKAQAFARKMTKAGFVCYYGPRRKMAAEYASEETSAEYQLLQQKLDNWAKKNGYLGATAGVPQGNGTWLVGVIMPDGRRFGKDTLVTVSHADVEKAWKKTGVNEAEEEGVQSQIAAKSKCPPCLEENGDPSAMELAPVAAELAPVVAESIPFKKVARDPAQHEADVKLAERYGPIKNAEKVYEVVGPMLQTEDQEVFLVLPLNLRGELKCQPYEIARGQRSKVHVGVEDVMRAVIDSGCEGYVVAHNHPSSKCTPSKADRDLTAQIQAATKPFGSGIKFIDHVVIGSHQCFSIVEDRMYPARGKFAS